MTCEGVEGGGEGRRYLGGEKVGGLWMRRSIASVSWGGARETLTSTF